MLEHSVRLRFIYMLEHSVRLRFIYMLEHSVRLRFIYKYTTLRYMVVLLIVNTMLCMVK